MTESWQQRLLRNIGDTLEQYGITLLAVETKSLDLPDENKNAVYERMISERNNIAATYQAEGRGGSQADFQQYDRGDHCHAVRGRCKGCRDHCKGRSRIHADLKVMPDNDPDKADFYIFLRSLDAAKKTMTGNNKTLIIDETSPIAQIFY